jgi:unsaturated chondroitin disaccharide hydrolase
MKKILLFLTIVMFAACAKQNPVEQADRKIHMSMTQMKGISDSMPRNVLQGQTAWNLRANTPEEWCSGFWDGCLWYNYALTGKEDVLEAATATGNQMLYLAKAPVFDHDLGFLVITSLLNGYRFSPDSDTRAIYKEALLACADSLCTLFNPAVGTILSWPRHVKDFGGHNTIMDNMINLELLLWAAEETTDTDKADYYRQVAISHADTTMTYHFREDGTSFHVAVYDPVSGKHLYNCTHQGLADTSVWARGQAWAIYGYTTMYRYTKEPRFLAFAQKVTDVYLSRLPEDKVPFWDFCDPRIPEAPKDASAACVVASALVELQHYVDADKAAEYKAAADAMQHSLSTAYLAPESSPAILAHSTGHHPANSEIDASIIYADYYYLEALYRVLHQ